MLKKTVLLLLIMLLTLSFASCVPGELNTINNDVNNDINNDNLPSNTDSEAGGDNETPEATYGEPVPTFSVDWPSEMLPDDFPDLGKVTKIYDSRAFVKKVTVNWNIVSEEQVKEIVDKLNAYLDYDHAWQDYFYSDGIKYKDGTEDELIRVVIRYMASASGAIEPNFEPQFYLEISGEGIPDSK